MPKIIGITGRAGAGKDTLAEILAANHGYAMDHFASPVKKICALLSGEPLENFYDRDLKEKVSPSLRMTRRKAMQLVGTEVGREMFHEDVWVDALTVRWITSGKPDIVISDVRMDNEALEIRANGGIIVSISRDKEILDGEEGSHSSEDGLSPELIDFYVHNTGTIEDLHGVAAHIDNLVREHAGEA